MKEEEGLSYDVDELFSFRETEGGYAVAKYLKKFDPSVTEVEIPAEFNGKSVVEIRHGAFTNSCHLQKVAVSEGVRMIGADAFLGCTGLRSIRLPVSLEAIGSGAFYGCENLCEVEFESYPKFGEAVFGCDPELPAKLTLMGAVRSRDITDPLDDTSLRKEIKRAIDLPEYVPWFCRSDVFSLAAENDCFRKVREELLDKLIECSLKRSKPELTAYLLDLKNRKFGFNPKSKLKL